MNKNQFAIKTLVPDEIYTDRKEFLDLFYNEALKAAMRRSISMVLLGQRRMGKTEIFKRVINRLFFEQNYEDPKAVVPVYYIFPDSITDPWQFSINYVENFIKWYTAFRMRNPDIIEKKFIKLNDLPDFVKSNIEITRGFSYAFRLLEALEEKDGVYPEEAAVQLPRSVSDRDDTTIVMFLDEIQNLHLPQHNFRIVGYMQDAVESPTCPHFVTGSAKLNEPLINEETINKILAIDLSFGFIYQELRDQVIKWIDRLNDHNITKWILYLAALEEEEKINPERIQNELKVREGSNVELKKIIDVMIKLSQGDLIDYISFGGYFSHVNDPVLQDFLKAWGKVEIVLLSSIIFKIMKSFMCSKIVSFGRK